MTPERAMTPERTMSRERVNSRDRATTRSRAMTRDRTMTRAHPIARQRRRARTLENADISARHASAAWSSGGEAACLRLLLIFLGAGLGACDDALDQRLAIVDAPRVLAVIAEPAEARPGATVAYRAVVVGPEGPLESAPAWAYCTTPKAPTEDNAVSTGCVDGDGLIALAPGGDPMSATGALPMDACLRFGPDVPPGGFRPRDADLTGGFYQPVRVDTAGLAPLAFGMSRITCNLANATPEAFRRYALEYVANTNPVLDPPTIDGAPIGAATRVAPDADVTLAVTWPADTIEGYLYYDRDRQALVDRREALRVSWFATGGSFPVDAIAIDEPVGDEVGATSASIAWHTPAGSAGDPVFVWVVLRDARGGIAVQRADLALE